MTPVTQAQTGLFSDIGFLVFFSLLDIWIKLDNKLRNQCQSTGTKIYQDYIVEKSKIALFHICNNYFFESISLKENSKTTNLL